MKFTLVNQLTNKPVINTKLFINVDKVEGLRIVGSENIHLGA